MGHDDDTDDNETGTKDERRNFGTTANGKVSGRFRFLRGSVSSGFRAPTPGQQNGFNIQSWFDPTVGDLVNNAVIPSISPVARLRGGRPLGPEQSINYTAGVVFGDGPFTLTADYFRIDVSDRIKRRSAAAGLPPSTCCHTFRATGITAYLSNGGTLSSTPSKLYDRTADTVTVDEICGHPNMTKPSVYIETSIVSYLTARPSRDLVVAAQQTMTREWVA